MMQRSDGEEDIQISGGEVEIEVGKAKAAPKKAAAPAGGGTVMAGRGMDVGTANLVSAVRDTRGQTVLKLQRNAFIDIKEDDFTKKMLTDQKVQYVVHNKRLYVLGDAAFDLANIFNRETRRPMKHGLISPSEADALPVVKMLVENVIGAPAVPGETCYFSIPAEPIDAAMNVIYHKGIFEGVLRKLGYKPRSLVEGHAVVFSELAPEDFTGIGISCGGGMFNVCVSYKSVPALSFSTTRAGDWIDNNVANVTGLTPTKACLIKERGVKLTEPRNREEEAVAIYYRSLIEYTLENVKTRFSSASSMPTFPGAIDIVCSGGTAMISGFIDVFRDVFDQNSFPLEVKNIRLAKEPLYSVAKGCLVAALTTAG